MFNEEDGTGLNESSIPGRLNDPAIAAAAGSTEPGGNYSQDSSVVRSPNMQIN
jgi:hypothetical protein